MRRLFAVLKGSNILTYRTLFYAATAALFVSAYSYHVAFLKAADVVTYFLAVTLFLLIVTSAQLALYGATSWVTTRANKHAALGMTLSLAFQTAFFLLLVITRHSPVMEPVVRSQFMLALTMFVAVLAADLLAVRIVDRLPAVGALNRVVGRISLAVPALMFLPSLALMLGWGGANKDGENVVIVTVDSWRFDTAGFTGGEVRTPHVDQLHRNGITFTNFQTHAPYTWSSLSSIMTSLETPLHEVRVNGLVLDDKFTTLAEALRDGGYRCYAASTDIDLNLMGLQQGFGTFSRPKEFAMLGFYGFNSVLARAFPTLMEKYCYGPNNSVPSTLKALEFIRANRSEEFFLWVHYYDEPHLPYVSPRFYEDLYNKGRHSWVNGSKVMINALTGNPSLAHLLEGKVMTEDDLEYLKNLYRAEVTAMDTQFGMIVSALRRYELLDNTLIILTADHGEDFSERGQYSHGANLYRGLVHVPMIMRTPKRVALTVRDLARGIDIAPTVLAYAGVERPDQFRGNDLLALIGEEDAGERERWCLSECLRYGMEWPHDKYAFAFTSDRYKLISLPLEGREELYDLEVDPGETRNIAASNPDEIARIKSQLEESLGIEDVMELVPLEGIVIGEKQRKMLKALGYINY